MQSEPPALTVFIRGLRCLQAAKRSFWPDDEFLRDDTLSPDPRSVAALFHSFVTTTESTQAAFTVIKSVGKT